MSTVLVKCTVKGQETYKAILMPLHPMYLWAYVELVKIGQRIRHDPDCTDEDRTAFLNEMTQERFFLNALYLALFDQSNVRVRDFVRTVDFNTSPLCITREFKHDEFRDIISARPVTNAPLFAAYDFFVGQLKNEMVNHASGVIADASFLKTTIEQVLREEGTQWLFLADRALPSETNLQAARLLAQPANRRQTLSLARSLDPFAQPLKELLDDFNLYVPTPEALVALMQDFANLISEGLLALSNRSGAFDERKQKGLLGMLLAARHYRRSHRDSIIVSIDSPTARQWLRIASEGGERRADLLGLNYIEASAQFVIDAIEVKTHEGPLFEEDDHPEENALDTAKEQISKTMAALRRVFVPKQTGQPDPPLVPPRREVLRELFYQEIQSRRYPKSFRLTWVPLLNELFQPQSADRVQINGHIFEVALSKDINTRERELSTGPSERLTHHILGTIRIQSLLEDITGPDVVQSVVTDEIRRVVEEARVSREQQSAQTDAAPAQAGTEALDTTSPMTQLPLEQALTSTVASPQAIAQAEPDVDEGWLKHTARTFERACGNFGIQIVECDIRQAVVGPSVVRFRFKIAQGQTRRKLDQNLEDIGREMSVSNILVKPIPNSQYLSLDVPSPRRRTYSLVREGLPHLPQITTIDQMGIVIGLSPSGEVLVRDLREIVHMLIGGSTRSGKSIFLYSAILSLLARHPTRESLELILCTSKPEDLIFFEGLPHSYGRPVIADTVQAIEEIGRISANILQERSQILRESRSRSIEEYNQNRETSNQIRPIVIIVDEFADLGDQVRDDKKAREAFYTNIRQIAQAGRSRGVHLILCTQRPTADLLPSSVKSLMNARVALKVNSTLDSGIILDQDGAEKLLGRGDMLFKDADTFERIQGYFCTSEEIEEFLQNGYK